MLDRTRDTDGDVKLRRDDLAGLANLIIVRDKAGIDSRTACTERRTELVGERFKQGVVVLATAQSATTGDDNLRGTEFGALGLGQFAVDEGALGGVGSRVDAFNFCTVSRLTASKAVVRTVMTLVGSALLTVARALPA